MPGRSDGHRGLVLRDSQTSALAAVRVRTFEHGMMRMIATEYPRHLAVLGERGVAELIARAVADAPARGITTWGPLGGLIELMVGFGEQFERSPDQAFAQEILAHPTLPAQLKIDLIAERLFLRTGGRRIVPEEGPR